MTTHIMGLTYGPKIDAVFSGGCNQTIRLVRSDAPWNVGDKLILRTWTGRPYRSPWGRRLDARIAELRYIYCEQGIGWFYALGPLRRDIEHDQMITEGEMDEFARLDGIVPPKASALISTLMALNGLTREQLYYATFRIVRWEKVKE